MASFRGLGLAVPGAALLLVGCEGIELQNRQPAQELARAAARPPGSVHGGWRVFQERCAGCHGATATGTANAPDLLQRVQTMGQRQFVSLVLHRYDWGLPATGPLSNRVAREALVDDVVQRREGELQMPAWQGEPRVTAHIADLYTYLAARADGRQGPGRPLP